jgi:hypothetical protein
MPPNRRRPIIAHEDQGGAAANGDFPDQPIVRLGDPVQPSTKASRSGLIASAWVVSMPCGYPG